MIETSRLAWISKWELTHSELLNDVTDNLGLLCTDARLTFGQPASPYTASLQDKTHLVNTEVMRSYKKELLI
tara:strand:+ start:540 stop:755 length:216 start_codon:yes stop_codon:yes gene_type:complete